MQPEYLDRLMHSKMEFYREVYKNSVRWDGEENIENKHIIIYCEQGFGDIIQFARYLPFLKEKNCIITLHCPLQLHELLKPLVDNVLDKEIEELPEHDFHMLSMSLPFVLSMVNAPTPYLFAEAKNVGYDDCYKIGIVWEGNIDHSNNLERSCPLAVFRSIHDIAKVKLFMLSPSINLENLIDGCEDMEILGTELNNFKDTAELIEAMDLVISIDTSVLHLAGALKHKTIGLLSYNKDHRWNLDINWYPSIKFIQQEFSGDWIGISNRLKMHVNMEVQKWLLKKS